MILMGEQRKGEITEWSFHAFIVWFGLSRCFVLHINRFCKINKLGNKVLAEIAYVIRGVDVSSH